MRWIPGMVLLAVLSLNGAAIGQNHYKYAPQGAAQATSPYALVGFWCHKCFSREPDPIGLDGWAAMLTQGWPPANVLSAVLSSQEYFDRAGDTPQGFARTLYLDMIRREPTFKEYNWVLSQLGWTAGPWERAIVAYRLLTHYPHALYPPFASRPAVGPP